MKIIITDDDRLAAMSLKTILESVGVEVAGLGGSGEEAVKLYDELFPDVMLMDIRMGGMDGIEAGDSAPPRRC